MRAAPQLQRVLAEALAEGGWFDAAHEQAVREAAGEADAEERLRAVRTLLAEETRLGMLVGVAVGFELAQRAGRRQPPDTKETDMHGHPLSRPRLLRALGRRHDAC